VLSEYSQRPNFIPSGRRPCAGMKVAKLELKLVLAMFLTGFEYQVG
jgi:cytochrome P450